MSAATLITILAGSSMSHNPPPVPRLTRRIRRTEIRNTAAVIGYGVFVAVFAGLYLLSEFGGLMLPVADHVAAALLAAAACSGLASIATLIGLKWRGTTKPD